MELNVTTVRKLASYLQLPWPDVFTQDWEYEVSSLASVPDWLRAYHAGIFAVWEQPAIINIAIDCYNDALHEGSSDPADWISIRDILVRDHAILWHVIDYWANPDEPDLNMCFPVTPLVRSVAADIAN